MHICILVLYICDIMKRVNREQFLQLPPNTLFHKYNPQIFEELTIKLESTQHNDFYTRDLFGFTEGSVCSSTNSDIIETGEFKWDMESTGRDGLYDNDQLFAVYDKEDVQRLITVLSKCL